MSRCGPPGRAPDNEPQASLSWQMKPLEEGMWSYLEVHTVFVFGLDEVRRVNTHVGLSLAMSCLRGLSSHPGPLGSAEWPTASDLARAHCAVLSYNWPPALVFKNLFPARRTARAFNLLDSVYGKGFPFPDSVGPQEQGLDGSDGGQSWDSQREGLPGPRGPGACAGRQRPDTEDKPGIRLRLRCPLKLLSTMLCWPQGQKKTCE